MDIEAIKEANPIEVVVAETYPLTGSGRYVRAEAHDSLVVDTENQYYAWNSHGEMGDVIEWVEKRENTDFRGAVTRLCERAGLEEPRWGTEDAQKATARRARYDALTVACRAWVRALRDEELGERARSYCSSRGWAAETVREAGLGYVPTQGERGRGGKGADGGYLAGEFSMHEIAASSPGAQAAMGIPAGMLVYPHVEHGRVVYVSGRSVEGKRHYNPKRELIGERRVFLNHAYSPQSERVVACEGQADAVTLAQWGIPGMALAGVAVNQRVIKRLRPHDHVYVALDQDEAGAKAARSLADALGPGTRLVRFPEGITDVNQWLQEGGTAGDFETAMDEAETWIEVLAREAGEAPNGRKGNAMHRVFRNVRRLNDFGRATWRERLAKLMGIGLRQYDRMLKAVAEKGEGSGEGEEGEDEGPPEFEEIPGGPIPLGDDGDFVLVETVYEPPGSIGAAAIGMGKTWFAARMPDGSIEEKGYVDGRDKRYVPMHPHRQLIQKGAVTFAPRVGELLPTADLVDRIQDLVHKYIEVSDFFERLTAYYVLLTWLYDAFDVVPYLRARGDYGCGKSRYLQVVGHLCFRPMVSSGATSEAALFRTMEAYKGTTLLDEADYQNSDYAALVVKILNQGYDRRQAYIIRCADKSQNFEPEANACFGPKIVAMRGKFEDEALNSRFLTEDMREKTREDIPINLPRSFWDEEAPEMQALLLRWRLEHWRPYIEPTEDLLGTAISDRLNQIASSLVTVVEDEGMREEMRQFLHQYNQEIIDQRGLSQAARVLEALVLLNADYESDGVPWNDRDFSTKTVAELSNQLVDFENHGEEGYVEIRCKPNREKISTRSIGYTIRNDLQLTSKRRSKFNGRHCVEWDKGRIYSLRKRYGLTDERLVDLMDIFLKIQMFEDRMASRDLHEPEEMPL